MKRIYLSIVLLLCVSLVMAATPRTSKRPVLDRKYPGDIQTGTEVEIIASDTSMAPASAVAWELLTRTDFTVMTAADTLRIKSDKNPDSSFVTLYGVKASDSTNIHENLRLSGKDYVYSNFKWLWFEVAVVDSVCSGTVGIYNTSNTTLTTILPTQRQNYTALHYTGKFGSGLKHWDAEVDSIGRVQLELRFYPYWGDLLNIQDASAYEVIDQTLARSGSGTVTERFHAFNPLKDEGAPVQLERMGVLGVFGKGTTNTKVYQVRMSIYDRTQ